MMYQELNQNSYYDNNKGEHFLYKSHYNSLSHAPEDRIVYT